ncbi:VapE domain-containing protein [uncultured Gilliamella sp.]|uniref:VapE domain-containing protein n=1 Tax=uncultured Gilliamella sp. TaxID=1193505 RepID=UPI00343463EC
MFNMKIYGASPCDWLHFDLALGLTEDLLPVVSNPNAVISDNSTLKSLGKTPSRYNREGKAVGFPSWTNHITNSKQIETWSKNPDYGICIQTRNIRAIDVDVSDPGLASNIKSFIISHTGIDFPCRFRADSSKFLLMFCMPGEFYKQIICLETHGIVEFLANGQQFVAAGTHPSGGRYQWENALPYRVPTLSIEIFNKVWEGISKNFNGKIISSRVNRNRDITKNQGIAEDEITKYLDENWNVLSIGDVGERYIECPFAETHTTESNETATAYFPAGTGGFSQGHFRCLHAHCMDKDDGDYLNAIGYRSQDFDVIPVPEGEKPLPAFKRDKNGKIESTINNVYLAVQRADICQINIKFDQFRDEIMFTPLGSDQWQTFTDADYSRLRIGLEKGGFKPIGRELIRDIVLLVADESPFDSATEWLSRLKWDGVPRIKTFLSDYFNADANEYTEAVSQYLWTALAGRVLEPGIKADMVPILVGEQGCGKSTGVAAISPSPDYFCEVSFAEKDDDLARKMRGRLVGEIGELRGLHSKELETIKAFITRTHENWIPKYREFATQFPRRLVFVGTTNQDEFLSDDTGNRRFLPVRVSNVNVKGVKANRDQLWAEAKQAFADSGIQFSAAERLAASEHDQYMIKDVWQETVSRWLNEPDITTGEKPIDKNYLTASEVLRWAIGLDLKNIGRREEIRISKNLQELGYKKTVTKVEGKSLRVFAKCRNLH